MSRGFLRTVAAASVLALAFAAPATADVGTTTTCAKQARAVTSAKKAVTKAQKARATSPKARKQRVKRVRAAKLKHTRAKKAMASCKAKVKPEPEPVPEPVPAPPPPVLSVAATTVGWREGFSATVAAPALPAGMVYRVVFRTLGTVRPCAPLFIIGNVGANSSVLLRSRMPLCPGPGRVSLHQANEAVHPLPQLGDEIAAVDVVVAPN